jgi:hypothetical protein
MTKTVAHSVSSFEFRRLEFVWFLVLGILEFELQAARLPRLAAGAG